MTELPLQLPSWEGEQVWLDVEKNGANTGSVAQQLAEAANLQGRGVGCSLLTSDRPAV